MTRFFRRMAAAVAVAAIPLAAAAVATSAVTVAAPGVSSPQCDPSVYKLRDQFAAVRPNWSRNVWTNECKPPPAPPAWWTPRPAYAPPYAPADVPPPPPPPPWAGQMQPRWDEGGQHWVWVRDLTATRIHNLRIPRNAFSERVTRGQTTATALALHGAQIEYRPGSSRPVIAPLGELFDDLVAACPAGTHRLEATAALRRVRQHPFRTSNTCGIGTMSW